MCKTGAWSYANVWGVMLKAVVAILMLCMTTLSVADESEPEFYDIYFPIVGLHIDGFSGVNLKLGLAHIDSEEGRFGKSLDYFDFEIGTRAMKFTMGVGKLDFIAVMARLGVSFARKNHSEQTYLGLEGTFTFFVPSFRLGIFHNITPNGNGDKWEVGGGIGFFY